MATTAPGSPYVESSDLVANYPAVSEALAERVDIVGVLPFADSTARGTALPSPTEGQYTYLQDTNATEYWDGSAWVAAGVAPGLVKITSNTFNVTSTLSVNNCFTSAYTNYLIMLTNVVTTGGSEWFFRLRASGTDATSSDYYWQRIYATGGSTGASSNTSATSLQYSFASTTAGARSDTMFYLLGPQTATRTGFTMPPNNTGTNIVDVSGGGFKLTTQFDGFSAYMAAGTITGTYTVYGLQS